MNIEKCRAQNVRAPVARTWFGWVGVESDQIGLNRTKSDRIQKIFSVGAAGVWVGFGPPGSIKIQPDQTKSNQIQVNQGTPHPNEESRVQNERFPRGSGRG